MSKSELGERGDTKEIKMNIQELKKWEQELEKGKIDAGRISRKERLKLINDATEYLLRNGQGLDSNAKIDFVLKMIEFYDNIENKFDTALKAIQNEINELESQST